MDVIILDRFAMDGEAPTGGQNLVFESPRRDLEALEDRTSRNLLYLKEPLVGGLAEDADDIVVRVQELREVVGQQRDRRR